MKNNFALSFGIALIVVGIINLFLETSNVVLFGVSLSAFIFSLISIIFIKIDDKKYEFIYIIPLLILLCSFCYGNELMKIEAIKLIVNSKLTSALTFISFGLSFVSEYITDIKFRFAERLRHLSLVNQMMNNICLLLKSIVEYRRELVNKKIIADEASQKFVERIENISNETEKKAQIERQLLSMKIDKYTIDDFDKAYTNATQILKLNLNYNKKTKKEE